MFHRCGRTGHDRPLRAVQGDQIPGAAGGRGMRRNPHHAKMQERYGMSHMPSRKVRQAMKRKIAKQKQAEKLFTGSRA